MKIDCNIDAKALEERFGLTAKNLAYATVNAVNATALQVQKQAKTNVQQRFTLRNPQFILRQAAIIKPFASVSQGRPYAEIAVGQKERLLLGDFERGAQRPAFVGKNVAVPITGSPARPSFASPVPDSMRFSSLSLQPRLTAAQRKERAALKGKTAAETRAKRGAYNRAHGAGTVWTGRQRTYMIPNLGVFQRTGPGKRDTVMLYKFVPSPTLKPRMGFLAMAQAQGQMWMKDNLEHAVIEELNRNRR